MNKIEAIKILQSAVNEFEQLITKQLDFLSTPERKLLAEIFQNDKDNETYKRYKTILKYQVIIAKLSNFITQALTGMFDEDLKNIKDDKELSEQFAISNMPVALCELQDNLDDEYQTILDDLKSTREIVESLLDRITHIREEHAPNMFVESQECNLKEHVLILSKINDLRKIFEDFYPDTVQKYKENN